MDFDILCKRKASMLYCRCRMNQTIYVILVSGAVDIIGEMM